MNATLHSHRRAVQHHHPDGELLQMEKRQYPRFRLSIYVNKIIGSEPHLARLRDISLGGIYLIKLLEPQTTAVGDHVGIELQLPGVDELVWATGKIVRQEQIAGICGCGIRFVHLQERDRAMLGQFVRGAVSGPQP